MKDRETGREKDNEKKSEERRKTQRLEKRIKGKCDEQKETEKFRGKKTVKNKDEQLGRRKTFPNHEMISIRSDSPKAFCFLFSHTKEREKSETVTNKKCEAKPQETELLQKGCDPQTRTFFTLRYSKLLKREATRSGRSPSPKTQSCCMLLQKKKKWLLPLGTWLQWMHPTRLQHWLTPLLGV